MTSNLSRLVEQLRAEEARLLELLEAKRQEVLELEGEHSQVQAALDALVGGTKSKRVVRAPDKKSGPTRAELLAHVLAALKERPQGISTDDLLTAVRAAVQKSGKSARGVHNALRHVLNSEALRVDGTIVTHRAERDASA